MKQGSSSQCKWTQWLYLSCRDTNTNPVHSCPLPAHIRLCRETIITDSICVVLFKSVTKSNIINFKMIHLISCSALHVIFFTYWTFISFILLFLRLLLGTVWKVLRWDWDFFYFIKKQGPPKCQYYFLTKKTDNNTTLF